MRVWAGIGSAPRGQILFASKKNSPAGPGKLFRPPLYAAGAVAVSDWRAGLVTPAMNRSASLRALSRGAADLKKT
ncbi:MAG: hypothetical protein QOJ40_2706 [Verrucomicrobiota bacterium]